MYTAKTINVSSPDDPEKQSEEFLELANGCLCCSIKDSGAAAIEKLMQRKGAFDHILLETTGLADPGSCFIFKHARTRPLTTAYTQGLSLPCSGKTRSSPRDSGAKYILMASSALLMPSSADK